MFKGVFQVADKFIKDAFLDKETGTGTADLALIEEDTLAGTVNGLLKVSVIKNDIRPIYRQVPRSQESVCHKRPDRRRDRLLWNR